MLEVASPSSAELQASPTTVPSTEIVPGTLTPLEFQKRSYSPGLP